ncbi:MAG: YARHG domain-containing protein [Pseudomonadota bacterium]|nr:YARHG domain-containing protein [Pseudomonadota bacterium]
MLLALLASFALAGPAVAPDAPAWQPPGLPVCSNVALLVKYDYAYVQQHICELCGKSDPNACEFDWPANDVPSCSDFDEMRNGIYAYYGRAFETEKWKAHFASKPWYRVNPHYSDALLSKEAQRNVAVLKAIADSGSACTK